MHYICIVKTTRPGGKTRNAPADMKETIQANIGSVAFTLDRDAYDTLKEYLDAVRDRLPEHDTETLDDIERHFAEIFGERIASPMQVVSLETVNKVIKRMGRPADFGDGPADARTRNPAPHEILRPLRRTVADRSIAGVCGGLARFFGTDPTLVRIITLLLFLFGGLSLWVYILLWIIVPEESPRITTNKKH